jgi:cytochrome bd ubiquinol oxidase subunit I
MWLVSTFLVAFGAHFSALWILMANSWMNTPAGYAVHSSQWGNIAYMTSFAQVVFTASFIPRLLHVWAASWMIGASLVMSASAWYLLKGRHVEFAKKNLQTALRFFTVVALLQVFIFGANMAKTVTDNQVPKLAAMEGVWQSKSCAPLLLLGWADESAHTTTGIPAPVPCLLSILSYQRPDATVTGLLTFPSNVWAPVNLTFQVYHLMIDLGFLFPLIGVVGWIVWHRRQRRGRAMPCWLLRVFIATVFLTEVATIAGWWTGEVGRQPWIVWNVLRTADASSPTLSTADVITSLITFALLYLLLGVLFLFLLDRMIRQGPEPVEAAEPTTPLPDTFREVFRRQPRAEAAG